MGPLTSIARQFDEIRHVVGPVCLLGMLYLLVRGRKRLTDARFGLIAIGVVLTAYFVLFTLTAGIYVEGRYYRPVFPFFALLSALGVHCFMQDVRNRKVVYAVLGLIFVGFVVMAVKEPVRAHRRGQTLAGLWLKQHDPDYKGFVVSNWTQPVYYAGMKYFDTRSTKELFLELRRRGEPFKYFILDPELDPPEVWAQEYVDEHGWLVIHREAQRDVRIYLDPQYGHQGEQAVPAPAAPAGP